MAAIVNTRDVLLQAASPRILDVTLPSNYDTSGDHTGTLSGSGQTNFQNSQITLSSNGTLQNAGGGQVTNGASIGSLNAGNISTGTLSASRIGAASIDATKLNVSSLSAISATLGTVTAGSITGTAGIDITGAGTFNGSGNEGYGSAAINVNTSLGSTNGLIARATSGDGVYGFATSGVGVLGQATSAGGIGGNFSGTGGADALEATGPINLFGTITITTQTISNLTVGNASFATNAGAATNATNATNASNSNSLGGTAASGWCRGISTNVSGPAAASSFGFGLTVVGALASTVQTRGSGNNVYIENVSDRRLKDNIQDEVYGLDFVSKLRPVTFNWKEGSAVHTYHNFIAQEVHDILTIDNDGLVVENPDGIMGVGDMTSILVKAIQELTERVKILEANNE